MSTVQTPLDIPCTIDEEIQYDAISAGLHYITAVCHSLQVEAGWWTNLMASKLNAELDPPLPPVKAIANVGEKLMLIVSEVAEGMEGDRKMLMDDKLPHRRMLEVELADAMIRIFDLAGAMQLDVAGALAEKLQYNRQRADHKPAHRLAEGGKQY